MKGFITGERVTIPEFKLVSNPTIRIGEVRERRFNIIDRVASFDVVTSIDKHAYEEKEEKFEGADDWDFERAIYYDTE